MSFDKKIDRINELKSKIVQEEYLKLAINEIANQLTESINKGHFLLYERKQQ